MKHISLFFVALLAASFAAPSRAPGVSQAEQSSPAQGSHVQASSTTVKSAGEPAPRNPGPETEAQDFLSDFLDKSDAFTQDGKPLFKLLFATLADPVQSHLPAAFDHDLAALQDGVQDSGYLFDSSWIPWETSHSYDSLDDQVKAKARSEARHHYPGILLFRNANLVKDENPYAQGLIVFIVTEKPTGGIDSSQACHALRLLVWAAQSQRSRADNAPSPADAVCDAENQPSQSGIGPLETHASRGTKSSAAAASLAALRFSFPDDTALILGPTYSGSLDSLVQFVHQIETAQGVSPPHKFLIRSSGFTSCADAKWTAQTIADNVKVQVDLGSADYAFDWWTHLTLDTLNDFGIPPDHVAILSEGESLFGQSPDPTNQPVQCSPKPATGTDKSNTGPWNLEFPREISALRSSYEQQGVLDNPTPSDSLKRTLHLNDIEGRSGDSVRVFGGDETVAAQESVLFGISGFLRSHSIRAIVIVATSEQDSYFLARFFHAYDSGVRIVVIGSSRLFMRGSTSEFRGDMTVSSFPLFPALYDWTDPNPGGHDQTKITFPNDSSQGEYIAVRDLLWPNNQKLPREYSRPGWESVGSGWKGAGARLDPPVYISALGGGNVWPVSFAEPPPELERKQPIPSPCGMQNGPGAKNQPCDPSKPAESSGSDWRLSMPFPFADHIFDDSGGVAGAKVHVAPPEITAGGFWQFALFLCTLVPLFYLFGVVYSNPVRHRRFAYLQPALQLSNWTLFVTVPAILSELSYFVVAAAISFPPGVAGSHASWRHIALGSGLLVPFAIVAVAWWKAHWPGNPLQTQSDRDADWARKLFIWTAVAIVVLYVVVLLSGAQTPNGPQDVLNEFREMHWESGLSLVPTLLFTIFAIAVWNYGALVGTSVLNPQPLLPCFPADERIGDKAGKQMVDTGMPIPTGRSGKRAWLVKLLVLAALVSALTLWPILRSVTGLSSKNHTEFVLSLAGAALVLMLKDVWQFIGLWYELRDMLQALGRHEFKRSFIPLRDFNWKNIWTFSAGSFQERRKVLAALTDCAFEMDAAGSVYVSADVIEHFHQIRQKYAHLNLTDVHLDTYLADLNLNYCYYQQIGSNIARGFAKEKPGSKPNRLVQMGPSDTDPFRDEERELSKLPESRRLGERFLCLLYIGFIQAVIARLRSLAISIVSVFSLVVLGVAVYPFQPMQPLFIIGAALFVLLGVVTFVVFSQMDKDPILARILQSNPDKLEWSFYSKYIDALALPLLTLLSSLLPGGAGRLIDLVRSAFSHAQ
jgi:hypothetical protein